MVQTYQGASCTWSACRAHDKQAVMCAGQLLAERVSKADSERCDSVSRPCSIVAAQSSTQKILWKAERGCRSVHAQPCKALASQAMRPTRVLSCSAYICVCDLVLI